MFRPVVLLTSCALTGCAALPFHTRASVVAAAPAPAPVCAVAPAPLKVSMAPIPNPPDLRAAVPAGDPLARIARANAAARVQPPGTGMANAIQVWDYHEGALYQIYAAPGRITDILLEAGENLSGTGPVAAGDTVRWIIGDTASGSAEGRRVHILVKPTAAKLQTNLIINTDRRTYHLELRATPATYVTSVAWRYPEDEARRAAELAAAAQGPPPIAALNFSYRIAGDKPPWRPVRVFDDGRQTVIEFPGGVAQSEMPPLFVGGPDGKATDLVNYRVNGQRIVVDRLFQRAELRLGDKRGAQRVRIERAAER